MAEDNTPNELVSRMLGEGEGIRRLIYTMLRPASKLIINSGVPLTWVKRAIETAAFQEGRRGDMSLRDISEALDISISKTALLSKQLKDAVMAGQPTPSELTRRIEQMLWSEPLTLARLNQVMPEESFADVERELKRLEEAGRVQKHGAGDYSTYELVLDPDESSWDRVLSRLDQFSHALDVLASVGAELLNGKHDPTSSSYHHSSAPSSSAGIETLLDEFAETLREAATHADELDGDDLEVVLMWRVQGVEDPTEP